MASFLQGLATVAFATGYCEHRHALILRVIHIREAAFGPALITAARNLSGRTRLREEEVRSSQFKLQSR